MLVPYPKAIRGISRPPIVRLGSRVDEQCERLGQLKLVASMWQDMPIGRVLVVKSRVS